MANLHFDLVSPERILFSGEVESVILPGAEGEMNPMAGHAPMMAMLKPGLLVVNEAGKGGARRLFVRGGFVEINAAGLTVLAEQAIPLEEISPDMLAAEIRNAQEDLADAKSDATRTAAAEKVAQLKDVRAALGH
jgi:F-type H+-transporting ATPase subunit epsilon